jgi:hypothetical protein
MDFKRRAIASATLVTVVLGFSTNAFAIPAFARKYGTSCQTCHTVYPKLTPFGEAFRRNGYLFPGVDGDYVKEKPVELGQEEYKKLFPEAVYPGSLPGSVPIAVGFNGAAIVHPDKAAGATKADNNTQFTTQDLIGEAHIWTGGAYDDNLTWFGEFTLAGGGSEIETAQVFFNNIVGPKHLVNVWAGRQAPTISTFGPRSSYLADGLVPPIPVTALFGGTTDAFSVVNHNNGGEIEGTIVGRASYSLGINAGSNNAVRPTEDTYGHLGFKFGGMRLDGEGSTGPADPMKPWAENAVTVDLFAYHSNSQFTNGAAVPADQQDVAMTLGAAVRGQYGSLELDVGGYQETHNHAVSDNSKATVMAQYDELSYILYPWLVPAIRFEYIQLKPENASAVNDVRIFPGIAVLIRPNLKFLVVGQFESCSGAPDAGWGPAGGFATPTAPDANVSTEVEAITVTMATSF